MLRFDRVLLIVIERVWIPKLLRCVTWKLRSERSKDELWLKFLLIDWRVLPLEETFLSMCRSSRVIMFLFSSKTQWQMFLLLYATMFVSLRRAQTWRLHTKLYKFGWHTSANNARMKTSRDLILGEVVYISINYRIRDFWLYSLNGHDF